MFHEYKWTRCETLKSLCGFGPYPRDPNVMNIPNTPISVFYGMQKSCDFSGRQFYALGTYDAETKRFKLLNTRSDYANNLFDGGEGYAGQHVLDPRKNRLIYIQAVIESDRDPCIASSHFWQEWLATRKIGQGWFGTLSLPRVINLWNISKYYDDQETVFLRTEPLPELSLLRMPSSSGHSDVVINTTTWSTNVSSGRHLELDIEINRNTLKEHFDVSTRVLISEDEYTEVGVRDATFLPGTDLWDEVNDDLNDNITAFNATECQFKCLESVNCKLRPTSFVYHSLAHIANNLLNRHRLDICFLFLHFASVRSIFCTNGFYKWSVSTMSSRCDLRFQTVQ